MQYGAAWTIGSSYDANGNLTSDGSTSFTYDMENRLVAASGAKGANLRYDPLGRLYEVNGPFGLTRFIYDGDHVAAEYNSAGTVLRRYMWGPGADEPILWDEGSAVNCSGGKFLQTDRQGSVVAAADCWGNRIAVNRYDEYGIPQSGNTGRFQYTGQAWLPELGMYYYKARIYSPTLGRFLQTDPIGYGDGLNWYAYVGSDPVNATDPSGTECAPGDGSNGCDDSDIVVTAPPKIVRMPGEGGGTATQPRTSIGRGTVPKPKPQNPEPGDCVKTDSQGRCMLRYGGDGKPPVIDPDYAKRACDAYHAMMRSNTQVADVANGPSYAGAGLVAVGGGGAAGRKVLGWLGLPGLTYISGVTSLVTRLLSEGPPPPGCQ